MSLNNTPSAERLHIGIFGKRNAGKSSIINAITGQELAIVSEVKGTTTDPVYKAMELLPLGPVVMIDTPGLDDEGELGAMRVRKSYQVLNKTDIALVVADAADGVGAAETALIERIRKKGIPYLIVYNKSDVGAQPVMSENSISVSAKTGENIYALKERIGSLVPQGDHGKRIVGDLLSPSDIAVLVVPVDSAAPKGRLILPQQQTIRDILDASAIAAVTKETELSETLAALGKPPRMVITDSQAFGLVSKLVPEEIPLTSFSILFSRYKGNLAAAVQGAKAVDSLEDGDSVLICEGCTHHRQCEDIGTVKMPAWIKKHTGKDLAFHFTSGTEFPDDLSPYRLIIHCGGCTLNEREMQYRIKCAADSGVPMTNYGTMIAYIHGILARSVALFPDVAAILK
ncbi:MAG: [FeFe] hydrogenase H-cluster maturation GTPase HydF [Oscillospiraceae bacterium]|nr:[FeFe] hydrogenase H-cluster maturation GTPase HydF [Oscillospiraceae bacterium]MDY3066048.1 [FeFe] hydrogenase H-cluster maturation GTPase HydF [Oscillospiraceae bacterium]